ncbi:ARM repeat-containing protein [Vararia minispora EC-137]|uniref:ARM repeat-containing protein n=1 Tax=Vararia minispora EC-137 TaxID=1314806 RepID=A0ACB8QBU8_9AGAM|nr:ARM repeat-containing protein [Vararia minispora EC-137]
MAVRIVAVATLKKIKNTVIGSPTAKLALAHDEDFIRTSAGPPEAVKCLLRANAHQVVLYAISRFEPTEVPTLQAAFARALRAVAAACAELVGPSQWGVQDHSSPVREDAKIALDSIFRREALDVFLPFLLNPHAPTCVCIAQLLGSSLRLKEYRHALSEWVPPSERSRDVRPRRGWERRDPSVSGGRQGGWVARSLTSLIQRKDVKLQEAALNALAALAKDNQEVAVMLSKSTVDAYGMESPSPLSIVLYLCKMRPSEVQLAASLCATHILRASSTSHHHPLPLDINAALIVLHSMNRLIASTCEPNHIRTKASFLLSFLLTDQLELCQIAFERGTLTKLVALVASITPVDPAPGWDEDEAAGVSALRESALTALATMAVKDDDIRREATDGLRLLPLLGASLSHRVIGVRYAACQCVRALGRSASVTRTSLVDSGLGNKLYDAFAKEDEDRLVTYAALMAVCNLIVEFSPLRQPFLDQGLVKRLSNLMNSGHAELRLNALWALKNLVYKCTSNVKRTVLKEIGWSEIDKLLADADNSVREQAFNIVRNFADSEEDIEIVFLELGSEHLLNLITSALESKNTDVLLQVLISSARPAACTLSNLANGSQEHQEQIFSHSSILPALSACLVDAPMDVRRAAVSCVLELTRAGGKHHELHDAGIVSTLRHICENSATMSPTTGPGHHSLEKQVKDIARKALDCIEHGVGLDRTP